jgi:hypothetical protein
LVFIVGNAECDLGAAGYVGIREPLTFGALQLECKEVIGVSANRGGAGFEAGKDRERFRARMIGPGEAAVDDGVDRGNGKADGAFVLYHDDVVKMEFRLGDVPKANESGVGVDGLGAGDEGWVAVVIFGF